MRLLIAALLTVSSAFSADAALLNLVMPDARVVGGIDVERARDSSIGRKLMDQLDANHPEFAKFLAATGFDPRRDIREVLFATTHSNAKNSPALILIRGVFDTARIQSFVNTAGIAASETVNGVQLFTKAGGKDDGAFAIVDSALALAGNKDAVRAALQRRGRPDAPLPAAIVAKAQSMSRDNDIWVISTVPVAELSHAAPGQGKDPVAGAMKGDAFKAIEQATVGIRFAAEMMQLTAETVSRTEKDATSIADVVRFLATMVQMNREKPDVQALAQALDSMQLSTDANTTRLVLTLPAAELEKIIEKGKRPARRI